MQIYILYEKIYEKCPIKICSISEKYGKVLKMIEILQTIYSD